MIFVEDTYILGALSPHAKTCPICGAKKQRVIDVAEFRVDAYRMTPAATILWNRHASPERLHDCIGLTCGCYGRLHRQLGHINHSQLRDGKI